VIGLDCARADPASIPPTLEEGSVRRRPALLSALTAAALVAVALAGCAPAARGAGNQPAGCTPSLPTGDASSTVTASGAVGTAPKKASFPTPLVSRTGEVTVLTAGHGAPASEGAQTDVNLTLYNGTTGKSLGSTGYGKTQVVRAVAGVGIVGQQGVTTSSLADAVICAQKGSRIALTTTVKKIALGTFAGLSASSTVVAVIDVRETYLGKADGVNQLPKDGMPNVITAPDGQPGIVIQELGKPTTARSETVKAGGGAVLKKDDQAVVLMTTWTWPASGEKPAVVDGLDFWASRGAQAIPLTSISKGGPLPQKFVDALVGQRVGSQVLLVLPPKDGFPASGLPTGVTAKDTLIFVVDILGVAK
jgi:energy-coupling factor transporter ATP-binding protein EcfA2